MALKKKLEAALKHMLAPDLIDLVDDDGVTGYVVSSKFQRMNALNRQKLVQKSLCGAPRPLLPAELRRVLLIVPLTPAEARSYGLIDAGGRAANRPKAKTEDRVAT